MGRTNSTPTGLCEVAKSRQGGPQGNAVTNLIYPMSIDATLKQIEVDYPNALVRAFQDDGQPRRAHQ